MVKVGLLVRLEAKPGKELEVEAFLHEGLRMVAQEPETLLWFALRLGPSSFAIFDAFEGEHGRQAHLTGRIADTLMSCSPDLLSQPPSIESADILAFKQP